MPEALKKIAPIVVIAGLILGLQKSGLLSEKMFLIVELILLVAALIYLFSLRKYFFK